MLKQKTILFATLLIMGACVHLSAEADAGAETNNVLGTWITEGYGAKVEIAPCRDNAETLCGRITWLWEDVDKQGRPTRDAENPDRDKRDRPLIGVEMLTGFAPADKGQGAKGANAWDGGEIYDPGSGRTYRSKMQLCGRHILEVKGCVLVICDGQIWRRPAPGLTEMAKGE
jgi:uncharacterized protein (DUF2147 family)